MIVGGFVSKRVTFKRSRSTPLLFLAGKGLPVPVGYALATAGPFDRLSSQLVAGSLMVVLAVAGWLAVSRVRGKARVLEAAGA